MAVVHSGKPNRFVKSFPSSLIYIGCPRRRCPPPYQYSGLAWLSYHQRKGRSDNETNAPTCCSASNCPYRDWQLTWCKKWSYGFVQRRGIQASNHCRCSGATPAMSLRATAQSLDTLVAAVSEEASKTAHSVCPLFAQIRPMRPSRRVVRTSL